MSKRIGKIKNEEAEMAKERDCVSFVPLINCLGPQKTTQAVFVVIFVHMMKEDYVNDDFRNSYNHLTHHSQNSDYMKIR